LGCAPQNFGQAL